MEIDQKHLNGLRERLGDGGFTFSPASKDFPTKGKMVSIFPEHGKAYSSLDKVTIADLFQYVAEKREIWSKDDNVRIGGWYDKQEDGSGSIYLDMTVDAETDERAKELCKKYGQIAYYDIESGKTVTVMTEEEQLQWEKENNVRAERKSYRFGSDSQWDVGRRCSAGSDRSIQGSSWEGLDRRRNAATPKRIRTHEVSEGPGSEVGSIHKAFSPNQLRGADGRWIDAGVLAGLKPEGLAYPLPVVITTGGRAKKT